MMNTENRKHDETPLQPKVKTKNENDPGFQYNSTRVTLISGVSDRDRQLMAHRKENMHVDRRDKLEDCGMTTILQPMDMSQKELELHEAVKVNDMVKVTKLIDEPMNINCKDNLDRTPLLLAAACGDLDILRVLLDHKANSRVVDKFGMTPGLWAAWFGHADVLRCLMEAKENVTSTSKQGMNMLHCAASNNYVSIIEVVSPHVEKLKDQLRKDGKTPLHLAAEGGHVEFVTKLIDLKCGGDVIDQDGMTPLHLAAMIGHSDVIEKLLDAGVLSDLRDETGKNALHMAAELGHSDVVTLLLKHDTDVNLTTEKEMRALHLASSAGHRDIVINLIGVEGETGINSKNYQGNTPLHLAARFNHTSTCDALVSAGASIDLVNARLETALHIAVESGHYESVFVLLKAGANTHIGDKKNRTALQMAVRGSYIHIVDMIIKAERQIDMIKHLESTGNIDRDLSRDFDSLQKPTHPNCEALQRAICKLALTHLSRDDWLRMANHWKISPVHVNAISHEYSGVECYRDHCLRLLMIWLCGLRQDENAPRILYEALVAIGRKRLAENVKRQIQYNSEKTDICSSCVVS